MERLPQNEEEFEEFWSVPEEAVSRLKQFEVHYNNVKKLNEELDEKLDLASRVEYTRDEIERALLKKLKKIKKTTQDKFLKKTMEVMLDDETRSLSPGLVKEVFQEMALNRDILIDDFGRVVG